MTAYQGMALERDTLGRLILFTADGQRHEGVTPVRSFPLSEPDRGISLVGLDGHEVLWIDRIQEVPSAIRTLLEEEFAFREFHPVIERIEAVSTFSTPSTWTVLTDKGPTQLILKGEEDIRRLQGSRLLVSDHHGVQFEIKDRWGLDRHSRRLLERFL